MKKKPLDAIDNFIKMLYEKADKIIWIRGNVDHNPEFYTMGCLIENNAFENMFGSPVWLKTVMFPNKTGFVITLLIANSIAKQTEYNEVSVKSGMIEFIEKDTLCMLYEKVYKVAMEAEKKQSVSYINNGYQEKLDRI